MASVTLVGDAPDLEVEVSRFDSDSFLDLHRHPRVVESVRRALEETGRGRAQPLDVALRRLRTLEAVVSAFHGREDTIVFPSERAAEESATAALLRSGDLVVCDSFCEGRFEETCRRSGAHLLIYAHLDLAALDRLLGEEAAPDARRLVVSEGVFGLHGHVAPLPGLHKIAARHGARLLIYEAHSLGVLGETGRGLEEHFALPGAIDLLVGSFSTAAGASGGYLSGRVELLESIRASLGPPAPCLSAAVCAGVTEAFRVMQEEPEHRIRLRRNARHLWRRLDEAGLPVPPRPSPILPVLVGDEGLLSSVDRALVERGIVCRSVRYPAVGRGDAILRLTAGAGHTTEELDRAVRALAEIGRRCEILRPPPAKRRDSGVYLLPSRTRGSETRAGG